MQSYDIHLIEFVFTFHIRSLLLSAHNQQNDEKKENFFRKIYNGNETIAVIQILTKSLLYVFSEIQLKLNSERKYFNVSESLKSHNSLMLSVK